MGAPLNPVPNVFRYFFEGFVDNNGVYKWGNVLHFEWTGSTPTNANAAAFAAAAAGVWSVDMAPECPSPTHLTSVQVTDLTSDSAAQGEWLGDNPGTRGDDSIPANAAVLMSYPAATRYKGGHGRSYVYAGGNADLDGAAEWSSAFTTECQTHWRSFITDILTNTEGGTSLSSFGYVRYHGKFLPNGGPPHYYLDSPIYSPVPATEIVARQEIASQRRRVGRRKA